MKNKIYIAIICAFSINIDFIIRICIIVIDYYT